MTAAYYWLYLLVRRRRDITHLILIKDDDRDQLIIQSSTFLLWLRFFSICNYLFVPSRRWPEFSRKQVINPPAQLTHSTLWKETFFLLISEFIHPQSEYYLRAPFKEKRAHCMQQAAAAQVLLSSYQARTKTFSPSKNECVSFVCLKTLLLHLLNHAAMKKLRCCFRCHFIYIPTYISYLYTDIVHIYEMKRKVKKIAVIIDLSKLLSL